MTSSTSAPLTASRTSPGLTPSVSARLPRSTPVIKPPQILSSCFFMVHLCYEQVRQPADASHRWQPISDPPVNLSYISLILITSSARTRSTLAPALDRPLCSAAAAKLVATKHQSRENGSLL